MQPILDDEQRIAWLRLARSERIGPVTFSNLINRFGSAEAALNALPEISMQARGKSLPRICTRAEAQKELQDAAKLGIRHVAYGESDYSSLLRTIEDKPPFLLVQGKLDFHAKPVVALVGSRNASVAGQKMATMLASGLGELGFVIASGLARGIDTAAHKASLKTGTIAVLAGGHNNLYPPENKGLAKEILENGGAVVSTMPPNFEPRGQDFPRRNRIISGLSYGTCVVEAAKQSGSLITARLANEQGRMVFGIPGSPLDPRAEGANKLIRDGAVLARNAQDIYDDIKAMLGEPEGVDSSGQTNFRLEAHYGDDDFIPEVSSKSAQDVILSQLSLTPVLIDDVIAYSGLPTSDVLSALCDLEIAGVVIRSDGNRISVIP